MTVLEQLFFRRPRILNVLHKLELAGPTSQTNDEEFEALDRYARGCRTAVEIGSYQGVSAVRIAAALAADGLLFCIDPWPGGTRGEDPNFKMFKRHVLRTNSTDRIKILRGRTVEVADEIPTSIDFAFIDGDHAWSGIEADWKTIAPRVTEGAVVCLHDTVIPAAEPWRIFDSVEFYDRHIASDVRFETIDTVYSMRVVRRKSSA
jgi:predicted O-methyltransferase YrrM